MNRVVDSKTRINMSLLNAWSGSKVVWLEIAVQTLRCGKGPITL